MGSGFLAEQLDVTCTAKGPPLALGNHEPTFSICTDSLNLDIPHDGMSVAMGFFHLVKVYPQCSTYQYFTSVPNTPVDTHIH